MGKEENDGTIRVDGFTMTPDEFERYREEMRASFVAGFMISPALALVAAVLSDAVETAESVINWGIDSVDSLRRRRGE